MLQLSHYANIYPSAAALLYVLQTVYLVLLPCYAFMLGTAIDAWQPLMLGVIVGAVRAAIGELCPLGRKAHLLCIRMQ